MTIKAMVTIEVELITVPSEVGGISTESELMQWFAEFLKEEYRPLTEYKSDLDYTILNTQVNVYSEK